MTELGIIHDNTYHYPSCDALPDKQLLQEYIMTELGIIHDITYHVMPYKINNCSKNI